MEKKRARLSAQRVVALCAIAVVSACGSGSSGGARSTIKAVDVARQAGIAQKTQTHGENCIADFNGDGITDLLLSAHSQFPWYIYDGQRDGRFVKGFEFPRKDRHGCAVADFNGDGRLDIYFSIGACKGTCEAPKELWIQRPDHTFVEQAAKWGITDPGGRGREPVELDANGDKLPDLFTGQEVGVDHPSLNRLWINRGGRFEQLERDPATNGLGNVCSAAADIDGDGRDELAVCTVKNGFILYRNKGGHFVNDTAGFGLDRAGRRTAKFADLNNDGKPDLVIMARKGLEVYLNEGGHYGDPDFTKDLADSKDVACGDVDGDGDLDLYVQQRFRSMGGDMILLNGGDGKTFTPGPELPSPSLGAGDTVTAIPKWKGTKRAAFVVNNGFQNDQGTRQLITFVGR